jgi:hypothetical protein
MRCCQLLSKRASCERSEGLKGGLWMRVVNGGAESTPQLLGMG